MVAGAGPLLPVVASRLVRAGAHVVAVCQPCVAALAATAVMAGTADRALAHATSGPALQQNLVCVMEGSA